jgi:hypothetical protein
MMSEQCDKGDCMTNREQLKARAKEAGSARALARKLGVHHSTICGIINGDHLPSAALSTALNDRYEIPSSGWGR